MDWQLQYAPTIWSLLGTLLFMAGLGAYSWARRSIPGARYFAVACLFGSLWLIGVLAETMAVSEGAKIAWYHFQALWSLPAVTCITFFSLQYVSPARWPTRRLRALMAIPPLLLWFAVLTNDRFHLNWVGFSINGSVRASYATPGWILIGYAMGLALVSVTAFAWLFARSRPHRWPTGLMIAGLLMSRALYTFELANVNPLPMVDALVPAFLFPNAMYAIALFGFRIFDPLPAARRTVFWQMREGAVVLDADWRVTSLNPAAESLLGLVENQARGRTVEELLPDFAGLRQRLAGEETGSTEISLQSDPAACTCTLNHSPLKDPRDLTVGHLLLLRDITDQRRAQAQLMEQRAALAALRERELLARELHDGLGQVLSYAKLQAQAARDLLASGRTAEADGQLAQLAAAMQDAHADMREVIAEASAGSAGTLGLRASLEQLLARFSRNHGISTQLEISPALTDAAFEPGVALQILRIVQEALTNARRHARPSLARITLAADDGTAEITIADDGRGFEPGAADANGYGLRFMRERAQEAGGSLEIRSAPGQGATVIVRIPLRKEGGP